MVYTKKFIKIKTYTKKKRFRICFLYYIKIIRVTRSIEYFFYILKKKFSNNLRRIYFLYTKK